MQLLNVSGLLSRHSSTGEVHVTNNHTMDGRNLNNSALKDRSHEPYEDNQVQETVPTILSGIIENVPLRKVTAVIKEAEDPSNNITAVSDRVENNVDQRSNDYILHEVDLNTVGSLKADFDSLRRLI